MEKAKIIRENDVKRFMEGSEYCRLYIETDRIVFGVSTLQPGTKGDVDPGHKNAYELFFVVQGTVLCHLPDENLYEELKKGDAILIPPPRPHMFVNVGEGAATLIWSQAKF